MSHSRLISVACAIGATLIVAAGQVIAASSCYEYVAAQSTRFLSAVDNCGGGFADRKSCYGRALSNYAGALSSPKAVMPRNVPAQPSTVALAAARVHSAQTPAAAAAAVKTAAAGFTGSIEAARLLTRSADPQNKYYYADKMSLIASTLEKAAKTIGGSSGI